MASATTRSRMRGQIIWRRGVMCCCWRCLSGRGLPPANPGRVASAAIPAELRRRRWRLVDESFGGGADLVAQPLVLGRLVHPLVPQLVKAHGREFDGDRKGL